MKKRKAEFPFYEWLLRRARRGSLLWILIERRLKARGCYIRHTVKDKYPRVYRVKLVQCEKAGLDKRCVRFCIHYKPHRVMKQCGRRRKMFYCSVVQDGVVCG